MFYFVSLFINLEIYHRNATWHGNVYLLYFKWISCFLSYFEESRVCFVTNRRILTVNKWEKYKFDWITDRELRNILFLLTLFKFSFEIEERRLSHTRCMIQHVSPNCCDKRMVRRCTRWSMANYFFMTSYNWEKKHARKDVAM